MDDPCSRRARQHVAVGLGEARHDGEAGAIHKPIARGSLRILRVPAQVDDLLAIDSHITKKGRGGIRINDISIGIVSSHRVRPYHSPES
jgi:hypothetical protein